MRQSNLFPKTQKLSPKDAESKNHRLLVRAGFIDQLMSGSWNLLPLGRRVLQKINKIIRSELDAIGCQEVLMPLLHPKNIWNETGRWESADEVMYKLIDAKKREFALSFTHEEIFLDLVRKHLDSYKDLPIALYHFSTKFRNELRAKSGILRGREFVMKDLYSVHAGEKDFWEFYEKVKGAYEKIFRQIGFDYKITKAGGGVFTDNFTHEFQVLAEDGEDLIYYCEKCSWAANKEVFDKNAVKNPISESAKSNCPECGSDVKNSSSIEVGNIFPFGTYYSDKMNVAFVDENGKKIAPYFGSYGIGTTRVIGAWVEVSHDEKGIIWSESIAPFEIHLIELPGGKADAVYERLVDSGFEVLWDDRKVSAGVKFADADLIGIPIRLTVSKKTKDSIELKRRNSEKTELLSLDKILKKLHN